MNNQNKGEAMEAKVIKTWAERIAHHPDRDAAEHIDEAKDAEIADLRAALASAQEEIAKLERMVEGLLDHCKDPECLSCGEIVCQYHEPLHFHHDGCPSCEAQP